MLIESLLAGSGALAAYIGRDAVDDCRYSYGLGRVWALENRLLPASKVWDLMEASSHLEVLKLLGETEYGADLAGVSEWHDVDHALDASLERTYALVGELLPASDRALVDVLRMRHDLGNLHAVVRGVMAGHRPERIERTLSRAGSLTGTTLAALAAAASPGALPGLVGDEGYASCLRTALEAAAPGQGTGAGSPGSGAEGPDPQRVAYALDGSFYTLMDARIAAGGGRRAGPARELLRAAIDLANLKTLVRAHVQRQRELPIEAFVAGGILAPSAFLSLVPREAAELAEGFPPGTLLGGLGPQAAAAAADPSLASGFERACDNALARWARERARTLAPDVILAYALAREREVAAIKLIFASKVEGIDKGTLQSLMREVHA